MPRRIGHKGKRFVAKKGTRAIAKRAERTAKELSRTREVKFSSANVSTTFSTAGTVVHLTAIEQGDGGTTRDGNQLTLRSLRLLGTFQTGTATSGGNVRAIIFQDKQQIADSPPAVTDILASAATNSLYNYPNAYKRFKILYDHTVAMTPAGLTTAVIVRYSSFKRWIFPTAKNVRYNGSTSTDIQKNGLYMLLIGENALHSYNINSQIAFTDA